MGGPIRTWRWAEAGVGRLAVLALAVMLLFPIATPGAPAAEWSSDKGSRADLLVTSFLARLDQETPGLAKPGLVYGIAGSGKPFVSQGYRDAAPGIPASAHTVYHVGSLAKQFTAAGVLHLIASGARLRDGTAFSLDLPLSRIFSGVSHWPGLEANIDEQPVTLRTLLTMTSNLPNFTRSPPSSTDPWGRIAAPDLLSEIKKLTPAGWPNTFEYSNTSYFLLAEAMEEAVVPGEPAPLSHRAYLRKAIFSSAGLLETSFVGEPIKGRDEATAIHRRQPVFDQPDWLKGSADITSSVADIALWNAALMEGRILSAQFQAVMFADGARVTPEIYYGMGWFIEHNANGDLYSHSGLVPGYTSCNLISVDAATGAWTSVTVLINTDVGEDLETLARDILRLALE